MATTAGVILVLILSLVSLSLALPTGKSCGTEHPVRYSSGVGKAIPTCGLHECDDPAVRDQYLLNAASPLVTVKLNVVYFGVLAGSNLTRYNAQLAFFQQEYGKHMNITWDIDTTVVEDRYQVVNGSDKALHTHMAKEFYVEGSATILWTTFETTDNAEVTLGYAYFPQTLDFDTDPAMWFGVMDIRNALAPQGTTMVHEVGHMLGLYHTFTSACNQCSENIGSQNLNIVGDFCSDTKPVWMTYKCDVLSPRNYDCNNVKYTTDLSQLPQDNYMAYTPDSCQDKFTPQQAARARCYLDKLLSFAVGTTTPGTSSSVPNAGGNVPIKAPAVKAPTTKAVSVASRVDVVAVLVSLAFVIVSL